MDSVIHYWLSRNVLRYFVPQRAGHNTLATALAVFWLLWSAVIIPAHTKGCVPLNGVANPGISSLFGGGCCERPQAPASSKDHSTPPQNPGSNCAICSFVAKLSAGVSFNTTLPALGFIEIAPASTPERLLASNSFQIFNSRAPPHHPAR